MAQATDVSAQVRKYAMDRYEVTIERAQAFAAEAKESVKEDKPYAETPEDAFVAKAVADNHLTSPSKLKECTDFLQAAGWLPGVPSLAEVLGEKGYVDKEKLRELLSQRQEQPKPPQKPQEAQAPQGGPGRLNEVYATIAVRLGFATKEQATECLKEVTPGETSLAVHRIMAKHHYINQEQHAAVVKELRSRAKH